MKREENHPDSPYQSLSGGPEQPRISIDVNSRRKPWSSANNKLKSIESKDDEKHLSQPLLPQPVDIKKATRRLPVLKTQHQILLGKQERGEGDENELIKDIADAEKQIRTIEDSLTAPIPASFEEKRTENGSAENKYSLSEGDGYDEKIQFPPAIPHEGELISKTFPRGAEENNFGDLWRASIRREVSQHLENLRATLRYSDKESWRKVEQAIGWDAITAGITAFLTTQGKYWDKPARQKLLIKIGWWILKIAQFTEILYTIGGVILSFFKVDFRDPVFWLGIIPTIIASPLTLVMNVSLVDPDTEVSDEICPDNLLFNHEHLAHNNEIKFTNPVINTRNLGFKNDFI
jgi:hypothetical protein